MHFPKNGQFLTIWAEALLGRTSWAGPHISTVQFNDESNGVLRFRIGPRQVWLWGIPALQSILHFTLNRLLLFEVRCPSKKNINFQYYINACDFIDHFRFNFRRREVVFLKDSCVRLEWIALKSPSTRNGWYSGVIAQVMNKNAA